MSVDLTEPDSWAKRYGDRQGEPLTKFEEMMEEIVRNAAATHRPTGQLLTADQAAKLLSVPPSWVLAQARANRIPHIRLSRYVRFRRADLDEFIESRRVNASKREQP